MVRSPQFAAGARFTALSFSIANASITAPAIAAPAISRRCAISFRYLHSDLRYFQASFSFLAVIYASRWRMHRPGHCEKNRVSLKKWTDSFPLDPSGWLPTTAARPVTVEP